MAHRSELKGLALQIAAQLPNDRQAALDILGFAKEIVEWRDGSAVPRGDGVSAELYELHPGFAERS
jgi:hypothetical protein